MLLNFDSKQFNFAIKIDQVFQFKNLKESYSPYHNERVLEPYKTIFEKHR